MIITLHPALTERTTAEILLIFSHWTIAPILIESVTNKPEKFNLFLNKLYIFKEQEPGNLSSIQFTILWLINIIFTLLLIPDIKGKKSFFSNISYFLSSTTKLKWVSLLFP